MVWIKLDSTCPDWAGIFGSAGHASTSNDDTEGIAVYRKNSATGLV